MYMARGSIQWWLRDVVIEGQSKGVEMPLLTNHIGRHRRGGLYSRFPSLGRVADNPIIEYQNMQVRTQHRAVQPPGEGAIRRCQSCLLAGSAWHSPLFSDFDDDEPHPDGKSLADFPKRREKPKNITLSRSALAQPDSVPLSCLLMSPKGRVGFSAAGSSILTSFRISRCSRSALMCHSSQLR